MTMTVAAAIDLASSDAFPRTNTRSPTCKSCVVIGVAFFRSVAPGAIRTTRTCSGSETFMLFPSSVARTRLSAADRLNLTHSFCLRIHRRLRCLGESVNSDNMAQADDRNNQLYPMHSCIPLHSLPNVPQSAVMCIKIYSPPEVRLATPEPAVPYSWNDRQHSHIGTTVCASLILLFDAGWRCVVL